MKLRRLTNNELVNIAPLPTDRKWKRLQTAAKSKAGSWSYGPIFDEIPNIFGVAPPLGKMLGLPKPTDAQIRASIRKNSYSLDQQAACLEIADLLLDWREKNSISKAVYERFSPISLGEYGTLKLWFDIVIELNGRPHVLAFDCRRSGGYTKVGRHFAMSVLHQQIRVTNPELQDAGLILMKFPQMPEQPRSIFPVFDIDIAEPLYNADEIIEILNETMSMWSRAQMEAAGIYEDDGSEFDEGLFGTR